MLQLRCGYSRWQKLPVHELIEYPQRSVNFDLPLLAGFPQSLVTGNQHGIQFQSQEDHRAVVEFRLAADFTLQFGNRHDFIKCQPVFRHLTTFKIGQRLRMPAFFEFCPDQVRGVGLDAGLELEIEEPGEFKVDQDICVLHGDPLGRRTHAASAAKRWSNSRSVTFSNSAAFARVMSSCEAAR